jgi:hypothetical protein
LHHTPRSTHEACRYQNSAQEAQKGDLLTRPNPGASKTRPVPGKAAARSATRRRMSVTSADGREPMSAQCPRGESVHSYPPAPSLPRQALVPWPYGELLNDARTPAAVFFRILLEGLWELQTYMQKMKTRVSSSVVPYCSTAPCANEYELQGESGRLRSAGARARLRHRCKSSTPRRSGGFIPAVRIVR